MDSPRRRRLAAARPHRVTACACAAVVLAACSTPSTPGRVVYAEPGFKGKDCSMVSPQIDPTQMRPGKPARVKARAHFVDGAVTSVSVLSGPVSFRQPVVDAMKQYKCKGGLTFVADQTFIFGVDPLMDKSKR